MTTTQTPAQTDHQVKEAILAELDWLPSVQADRIGVAINDGAVTLSGQVPTYPEKTAAVRAAFRVRGVTAVADEVEVRNTWTRRQDADIARDATDLVKRSLMARGDTVKVEVHDRRIILSGTVTWHYEREAIKREMAGLPGVVGVQDNIALKPHAHVSAATAKAKIADALRRNASVEASRVNVEVNGDRIRLHGSVATWAERTQAAHAAWATPGVVHVENELHVTG